MFCTKKKEVVGSIEEKAQASCKLGSTEETTREFVVCQILITARDMMSFEFLFMRR